MKYVDKATKCSRHLPIMIIMKIKSKIINNNCNRKLTIQVKRREIIDKSLNMFHIPRKTRRRNGLSIKQVRYE